MRRIASVLALVLALPVAVLTQGKPAAGSADQTLLDIERRWAAASLKSDVAALDAILAANWTQINADGQVDTRAQALDRMKTSKMTRSEVSDMKVSMINPTTAVVTGVWMGMGTGPKGEKINTSERWTDVFVNQNGAWKCVASQQTTIKK